MKYELKVTKEINLGKKSRKKLYELKLKYELWNNAELSLKWIKIFGKKIKKFYKYTILYEIRETYTNLRSRSIK